jgi:RimJ/RimL family protein N-acetyltransferase
VPPLRLVPLTPELAETAADLLTAIRPDEPFDPVMLRYRLESPQFGWTQERFLIQAGDEVLGAAAVGHAPWEKDPERFCYFDMFVATAAEAHADQAVDLLERRALAHDPRTLLASCTADQRAIADAILDRGYERDREGRLWELDLGERREYLHGEVARTRGEMREQGIVLRTLAASPAATRYEKLLDLLNAAFADVPHTGPSVDQGMAEMRRRLGAPDIREDRYWTAWAGDELAAISFLKFPPVRGNVYTGFTGSARPYRGRGIASAVKMETLAQAIELGVTRVRTGNDEANAPMLHINERLGYRLLPGELTFIKRLQEA